MLEDDDEIKSIQKAIILWVADGKKPATWQQFVSEKWEQGAQETRITPQKWHYIDQLLSNLGLVYTTRTCLNDTMFVQPKDGRHLWVERGDVFIARKISNARELADAVERKDDDSIGRLLGFPESAVIAYVAKDTIPLDQRPSFTNDISHEEMKFLNHMVSKDNWQKEISYLPIFASDIKRISPAIYKQCIKRL
jgi:hypothetical protein